MRERMSKGLKREDEMRGRGNLVVGEGSKYLRKRNG